MKIDIYIHVFAAYQEIVLSHMPNFNRHFRKVKFVKYHNCLCNYATRNRFEIIIFNYLMFNLFKLVQQFIFFIKKKNYKINKFL